MAHFYGTIQGNRGRASRLGSKASGLSVRAASWQGAVDVRLFEKDGVDMAEVSLTTHHGRGINRVLYCGPVAPAAVEGSESGIRGYPASYFERGVK